MWCEISAKGEVLAGVEPKKQTNVEPPPFPDLDPDPDPGRPYGGQLWQTAVASADRDVLSLHASHGRLSIRFFFFYCCCCVLVDRATVYCCVALSEWSCREKGKKKTKVCESCLQTLWWICSSSLSHYCFCNDFIQEAFLSQQFVLFVVFFVSLSVYPVFFSYSMRCQESNVVSFLLLINDILIRRTPMHAMR